MTRYEILRIKAENCRAFAELSKSEWARNFWREVANKLELMAANLPIIKAEEYV